MSYKWILFDWDGCLAMTLDLWLRVYRQVASEFDVDTSNLPDKKFVEISFGKWAQGFEELGVKDYDKAYERAIELFKAGTKELELYPGAVALLEELADKGKKMALLTSSYLDWIQEPISRFKLEKYFDVILAKDDVVKGKPDPEIIDKAINLLGATKKQSLIVGDSDKDLEAGNNAGVDACLYYPKSNQKFYTKDFLLKDKPKYVIRNLSELVGIVK